MTAFMPFGYSTGCLLSITIQTAKLRNAAMDGEFRKVH